MAVENKFKLNIIAASVLMGLSLSSVAVEPTFVATNNSTSTKAASVGFNPIAAAQASAPVDAAKLAYKGTDTVSSLFTKTGKVGAYEEALNEAFGETGAIDASFLKVISDFNKATTDAKKADDEWNSFVGRARVVGQEYDKALEALYGTGNNGAYTDNLTTATSLVTVSNAGAFGKYAAGFSDFKNKLTAFQQALIGSDGKSGALSSSLNGSTTTATELQTAVDKVQGYRAYLQTWAANQAADLKVEAAKNQIMATLPELKHFVTANGGLAENSKISGPDLAGKYKAFSDAVTALQKADKTTLSSARSTLQTAATVLGTALNSAMLINPKDETSAPAALADIAAVPASTSTPASPENLKKTRLTSLMTAINNAVTAIAATDTDRDAWAKLEKSGKFSDLPSTTTLTYTSITGINDTKVDSVQDAIQGLHDAFKSLCGSTDAATVCKKDATALVELQDSWTKLMGADGKGTSVDSLAFGYKTARAGVDKLKDRIAAVNSEFSDREAAYSQIRKNYFAAYNAYHAPSSDNAIKALTKLETAFTSLKTASADLKTAINTAARRYDNEREKGIPDETALTNSLGELKTLIPVKLQLDSIILDYQQAGGENSDTSDLSALSKLQATYQSSSEAMKVALTTYDQAMTAYKDADSAYKSASKAGSGADVSKASTDLTIAAKNLLLAAGYAVKKADGTSALGDLNLDVPAGKSTVKDSTLIQAVDKLKSTVPGAKPGEFVGYSGITVSESFKPEALMNYSSARDEMNSAADGTVSASRKNIADSLRNLADLRVLYTDKEWSDLKIGADKDGKGGQSISDIYLAALESVGVKATSAEVQQKAENAGKITHNLGWADVGSYDFTAGRYNPVILETDKDGKVTGIKRDFDAADLYTGTKDNPFETTVLNIQAPPMGAGAPTEGNIITVGEASSKDKKATPVDVWAKTDKGAVKLSGDLKAAMTGTGQDGASETIRGADRIVLQNMNIHNSILADKLNMLTEDMTSIGLTIETRTTDSRLAKDMAGALDSLSANGIFSSTGVKAAPKDANILLDNLNITLQNDSKNGKSNAIDLSGTGNHILAQGGVLDAGIADNLSEANVLHITGANNTVDFTGSTLKGDIYSEAAGNKVSLKSGTLTGDAISDTGNLTLSFDGSTWTGSAGPNSPDVILGNNSIWNVKPSSYSGDDNKDKDVLLRSSVNSLKLSGSNTLNLVNAGGNAQLGGRGFAGYKEAYTLHVDTDLTSDDKGITTVTAGAYSPGNFHTLTGTGLAGSYQFGALEVGGLASGGQYSLLMESAGAEPYTIGGRLADDRLSDNAHAFVSYQTSSKQPGTDKDGKQVTLDVKSDADFTSLSAPAELGVYQYAAEKVVDGVNNRTNIYYSSTGKLSNSAATAISLAAAPVDVANLQSDTLAKHMNSVRHGKDSGVWVSYFGGESHNTTTAGPEYTLKTNGVMLGADTLTENNWLAGVAVSSARSDMSVMNSSGDLNSYGAQFYMSRRYDSGVFVDSALQFNHFSNTAKARMINGQQAKADFSGNSYGLEAKVGYTWNSEGFFAEPYVRAAASAFDGEHYALSNGMTVNSNDYKSMLGEIGADLGYQYSISGGYVKPYLHLAALNEFADGNSVRVNNVSLDNSVKGSAFQAGLGAEVKMTDNLGGYAAFDYTKGEKTERPWQATVGVNYTW
ncbi:autotransporter outer membrane beta-barrel domain-containing protein [Salmonella enterica subsp. enterica]|nr:autotransporter outer membrane beta-barrel domain-containing protein [Salmonella enterica subsp. enterica serovar Abaetetuba]